MCATFTVNVQGDIATCRARALWGLTRNLRKPRNTAKCLPTPSLHFCYPGATGLRFRPGRQPAVEPTAPLSGQHPHDARDSGSSLGAAPWSKFALQRQPSVRQAALEQLPTTNAVHDRLLQSMRVRFSGSEQWSSPVKPPRSQNYVKPHDARTRVHVAISGGRSCACSQCGCKQVPRSVPTTSC